MISKIVQGTFYATEYTQERLAAMKRASILASYLVKNHPEIANMYKDLDKYKNCLQIATEILGGEAAQFPQVCTVAVHYAIKELLPEEERKRITSLRKTRDLESLFKGFDSEIFKEHCKNAVRKRKPNTRENIEALLYGRGRTPWSDEEKEILEIFLEDPEYRHQKGAIKSTPNYILLAEALNILCHDNKPIRYANSVANFVKDKGLSYKRF